MNQGPIYLAGADRSGTTLMYALLSSHPHIAMPYLGSNMWTFFYGKYGDLRRAENFERCLADLLRYKNVIILNPNVEQIRREFWQGEPTYARLFAIFHDHFAARAGKPRWGDKTSYVERYADQIFAAYPEAVMIHLIRDPRDRYASAIKRWPDQKGQVGGATARWLYSVGLAQRNLKKYPERYMIVRYEKFVAQPHATMLAVCSFLDEDYDPSMFTMSGAKGFVGKGGNSSFERFEPTQITTAAIGRFRKALSPREIAFIEIWAAREMSKFGYERESKALAASELLRFYSIDMPANLSKMAFWRMREVLQQTMPSRIGRAPMAHRFLPDPGTGQRT